VTNTLRCQLRSPDRTFYDGEAVSVTARSPHGEFAVLANHAPLLAELAAGPLRIRTPEGVLEYACFGGTLSMEKNRAVVLCSDIVPRDEIEVEAARRRAADPSVDAGERERAKARLEVLEKVVGDHD